MASMSGLSSLSSSSAHLFGSQLPAGKTLSLPSRVGFRPLHVSAGCATTAERTKSHVASPGSLYEILGIQMGATCQEIKTAYRKLARVLHPDVATTSQKEEKTHEFIKIHEAYETLSDPEKRADYDRSLFWQGQRMSSPFVTSATAATAVRYSASGFTKRRWETDQCW
ncbi:hypothetical protein JCGZ_08204 [Jatropha curcas]|uniref:J domain-containing protein n=1 Tax=Jatropha curcas TaxID=180498 RepID=A0A067KPH3_JATCU|nr:chaperone protein dnaJ 11, chloroplastic [Jatropha curcas]KDP36913.1 hypothetical protein JCGZ_08204 [Jatropha curcas]